MTPRYLSISDEPHSLPSLVIKYLLVFGYMIKQYKHSFYCLIYYFALFEYPCNTPSSVCLFYLKWKVCLELHSITSSKIKAKTRSANAKVITTKTTTRNTKTEKLASVHMEDNPKVERTQRKKCTELSGSKPSCQYCLVISRMLWVSCNQLTN